MMKAVVAGLLAAVSVVPALASAQDVSVREAIRQRMEARAQAGDRGEVRVRTDVAGQGGGGWQRPERPRAEAQPRPADAPQGGNWQRPDRSRDDRSRPDRPREDWRGRDRADGPAGGWQQRPDRKPDAQAGGWQQRPDRPAPPVQANRDPRDGRPLWTERNWRGDGDARADRDRRDRDARADRDRRDRDWNRNDRGWDGRRDWSWNDRGRDWGRDRGGWDRNDRRDWNRDWRRDPRYDWGRYRAANRAAYRLPRYYAPYGWNSGYRRFGVGVTLSSVLFAQNYWIDDPFDYRLPPAYGPYRWVRYYDDALLVDVYTGRVVDVVYDVFW